MATPRLLGGRYQVGELVGYGGTGEVHRGRDVRLGRDVAIKMLRPDLFDNDEALLRLRREIRYATRLIHPNIGVISDVGEESGKDASLPYIVMEFINGRTLKEVLAAEGRLLPRRAVEMTADLASALAFVHGHGLVHSAVKPGNVMLTAHGQIKLIGFDLVRAPSGETEELEASSVIGTAAYISPEQATGGSVDARSDIYSTGCTLFALLCGRPPFLGDSPVAVAYQHVRADRPAPSTFNPDVAEAIDAIVLRTMARDPLNRYQSAQDLYADLKTGGRRCFRASRPTGSGHPIARPPVAPRAPHAADASRPSHRPRVHQLQPRQRSAVRREAGRASGQGRNHDVVRQGDHLRRPMAHHDRGEARLLCGTDCGNDARVGAIVVGGQGGVAGAR